MTGNRRLGRGLEALLGRSLEEGEPGEPMGHEFVPGAESDPSLTPAMDRDYNGQLWVDVVAIDANPHQPRREFNEVEIADLADSIREHGVLQPLVVRQCGERFELVAGERRLRAARAAGWERVPVQLRDVTDQQMAELAIVENIQRKDLSALEKASCFQRYLSEYQCTQEELAARIHIDRSTIANLIRLLELPDGVKQMLDSGALTPGHARALLPLGDESEQLAFARRVKEESLSVRAVEQAVKSHIESADGHLLPFSEGVASAKKTSGSSRPEQIAALEQEFKTALGTQVAITQNAKGKGKITIQFANADEFERLRAILAGGQQSHRISAAA